MTDTRFHAHQNATPRSSLAPATRAMLRRKCGCAAPASVDRVLASPGTNLNGGAMEVKLGANGEVAGIRLARKIYGGLAQ
jgi:hypothetical protein